MRFAVWTLGCKVNQYDSQVIRESLISAGHIEAAAPCPDIDTVIVNTCTVTHRADAGARRLRRRALQTGARVIVTGCLASVYPEQVRGIFPAA
ncbi:MAG TPA: tRNA (N(6)-L-threonylcarbamoyladenosine(37)-C(2))-methylthiotransferase MtaB, partial [Deltaproteobacteria bacterium]|nr:tRNA (N(6)-L-threonylcarbamoyladenosine(37)-C(2))-methylthiotransferase MtaB [Deltaproteobacteria bacterium]